MTLGPSLALGLDLLERALDEGDRPHDWPAVRRQLAPLARIAEAGLTPAGRRRLRAWLRDASDHPTLYALGLALALRTAGDAEAAEREALERVRALDDPATIVAALAEALGRELTPEERAGLAPTRVEASDARHNAEIVGPHNEAARRPDRLSPREKNSKIQESQPCARCGTEPRQPAQRWGRRCRTAYERERRRQRRYAECVPTSCVTPAGFGWGFEVCGERGVAYRAEGWAPGCGQRFPAWHQGQIYCCNGHGRGAVMHSADCPLVAKAPLSAPTGRQ